MKRLILAMAVMAVACSANRLIPVQVSFSNEDFEHYSGSGPCTIEGQAFLVTRGGEVKYGAGRTVSLIPNTAYLREVLRINSVRRQAAIDNDDRYQKTIRKMMADGEGEFEFRDIPCGDYYAWTRVEWEVPDGWSTTTQGGIVWYSGRVTEAESPKKVILTYPGR